MASVPADKGRGTFFALKVMAVVVLGQWCFRRRGWFT